MINKKVTPYGNYLCDKTNNEYINHYKWCAKKDYPSNTLLLEGLINIKNVMDAEKCNLLSQAITARLIQNERIVHPGQTKHFDARLDRPHDFLGEDILNIFDTKLGDKLRAIYGSEFRIIWFDCYRTWPTDTPKNSWLWHIDNEPPSALKVLLYLTDTNTTGGGTLVVDFDTSQKIKIAGYTGLQTEERLEDLAVFSSNEQVKFNFEQPHIASGSAIILNTNCFHRGLPPTEGFRDVLSYYVIPSKTNWRKQLKRHGLKSMQKKLGWYPKKPSGSLFQKLKDTILN